MILRRLADAIKQQNWFTVTVEVLIVVIGIFLGLQANSWNQSRMDRAKEDKIILRLHTEVIEVLSANEPWFSRSLAMEDLFEGIVEVLNNSQELREFTAQECGAIITSNRFGSPRPILPIIEEIFATGDLTLIESTEIRNTISKLYRLTDERSELNSAIGENVEVLIKQYPSLIPLDGSYDSLVSFRSETTNCDARGMQKHQGFKNDFFDNLARHYYYTRRLQQEQKTLEGLHELVDAALMITH
jgi:hypothetical protein